MIIKSRIKHFLLLLLVVCSLQSKAQTYGEWLGADLTLSMPHNFSFMVKGEGRIHNDGTGLYKYLLQYGIQYKISKRFDVALSYRSALRKEKDDDFHYRDKLLADFFTDVPVARFKIKNRLRYQRGTKSYVNSDKDLIPKRYIRDKLIFKYDIKNCKLTPVIFGELFFPLNEYKKETIDEYRLGAEVKYKINGKQSFKAGLLYQNDQTVFPLSFLMFRFSYSFDFSLFNDPDKK